MEKAITRMISFSPPDISDAEFEEVTKTLKSGWITTGPRTKEFEQLSDEDVEYVIEQFKNILSEGTL